MNSFWKNLSGNFILFFHKFLTSQAQGVSNFGFCEIPTSHLWKGHIILPSWMYAGIVQKYTLNWDLPEKWPITLVRKWQRTIGHCDFIIERNWIILFGSALYCQHLYDGTLFYTPIVQTYTPNWEKRFLRFFLYFKKCINVYEISI